MSEREQKPRLGSHVAALREPFHQGSVDASRAFEKWLGRPASIELDALMALPLSEATGVLDVGDEPVCFCSAEIRGLFGGELILAFDDASGLALADLLLDQPVGATQEWSEMATSAVLETANILGCAFLNSLARSFSRTDAAAEILPTPPRFSREFAECLLEFALMGQAAASDEVVVASTRFQVDQVPLNWTLLLVPDGQLACRLHDLLPAGEP